MTKRSNAPQDSASTDVQIVQFGRDVLQQEADALAQIVETLDSQFAEAVRLITNLQSGGRVILSGMGKAGFIAMKISASFASIGIASFFLHPAEAVHGDLGRFSKADVALILSNSGGTPEILRLLPHIKKIGCSIISITGNPSSALGEHSDVAISIGKLKEAGPFGLAPTTSTTAMLAVGDALLISVVHELGITKERFALYHPGGDIGKALTLVSEIMRKGPRHVIIPLSATVSETLHLMMSAPGRPGAVSVIDSHGTLVGIFTDGDIRRRLSSGTAFMELPLESVMSRNPKTIQSDRLVEEALHLMSTHQIDDLVVVDEAGKPVGVIDIQDIVAYQAS